MAVGDSGRFPTSWPSEPPAAPRPSRPRVSLQELLDDSVKEHGLETSLLEDRPRRVESCPGAAHGPPPLAALLARLGEGLAPPSLSAGDHTRSWARWRASDPWQPVSNWADAEALELAMRWRCDALLDHWKPLLAAYQRGDAKGPAEDLATLGRELARAEALLAEHPDRAARMAALGLRLEALRPERRAPSSLVATRYEAPVAPAKPAAPARRTPWADEAEPRPRRLRWLAATAAALLLAGAAAAVLPQLNKPTATPLKAFQQAVPEVFSMVLHGDLLRLEVEGTWAEQSEVERQADLVALRGLLLGMPANGLQLVGFDGEVLGEFSPRGASFRGAADADPGRVDAAP